MPKVSERWDWRPLPKEYERGMTKVYFIDKCPMSDQCTKSFKDAKVWAETQTGSREQLAKHYINSGNHEMGEEEAMDAASSQTLQYRATCHKVASILNFTSLLAGGWFRGATL